jgi:uncharacterized protein
MDQCLSMAMLTVSDLQRSKRFYEDGLRWKPLGGHQSQFSVKYLADGVLITMIDRKYLVGESGLPEGSGSLGIVLVVNVNDRAEVDRVADEVLTAGGIVTSPARLRDGGLYTFYFLDPDGNPWEIVWNPKMSADQQEPPASNPAS